MMSGSISVVYAGVNANCRLTLSKELGDVIFEHCGEDRSSSPTYLELLSLAHDVYSDVSAHVEAMTCYMKQGRVSDAMQYAVFTEHCMQRHLVDVMYHFFFFFFFFSGMHHSPLGVCSSIRRHQPPQRTVMSQVDCFVQCEVVGSHILLDGVQSRDTGTPWWSLPVFWCGSR